MRPCFVNLPKILQNALSECVNVKGVWSEMRVRVYLLLRVEKDPQRLQKVKLLKTYSFTVQSPGGCFESGACQGL